MAVISKENKKKLSWLIDDLVKLKNPILETADGWVFSVMMNIIDDNLLDKTKVEFHPLIDKMVGELGDQNFEEAAKTLGEILSMVIDTPIIDGTEQEVELYKNVFILIAQVVDNIIEKYKQ